MSDPGITQFNRSTIEFLNINKKGSKTEKTKNFDLKNSTINQIQDILRKNNKTLK